MLKSVSSFFIFFTLFLNLAYADYFGSPIATPVEKVEDKTLLIKPYNLKLGETGIIIRWLDDQHSVIVAKVIVKNIDKNNAELIYEKFDGLKQDAFPTASFTPREGDEVLMRHFYNRLLIISPNQEIFTKVKTAYKDEKIEFISPDLFSAMLATTGNPAPRKKEFREFCNFYSVGVVYIVNGTKGQAYDCQSFALLHEDYISGRAKSEDTIKPFYSRLGDIKTSWINLKNAPVDNYYLYYDALVKNEIVDDDTDFLNSIFSILNLKKGE